METAPKSRIVILGGGFAGAYCAQALERTLKGLSAGVSLIDKNNYFIFYPLLIEAGTGSLEPRHAVVSIRSFLQRTRFMMAEVLGLDVDKREIRVQLGGSNSPSVLGYDQLVLALGSVTNMPEVPGLREYGYEMKSLTDAVSLRDRATQLLELADALDSIDARRQLLHFVVVGGNFTGVEVAGEFQSFLTQAASRYRNLSPRDPSVTLVELSGRILGAVDEDLAEYAVETMRRRRIEVLLNTSVSEIRPDSVILSSGVELPASTVVWCAGIAPSPILDSFSLPKDPRGYLLCENDLRVRGFENIWAIGDCAVNPDENGQSYPATAQHAVGQASHLAKNLSKVLRGKQPDPCRFSSKGSLVGLGCRTGVAKVFGVKLAGWPAWFLWRTVYLLKMPGWGRRIRVALDWTMDLFFKRDYVQLGVHEHVRARRKTSLHRSNSDGVEE